MPFSSDTLPSTVGCLAEAYAACQRLTRGHYENFPVASLLLPRRLRQPIEAIYRFARGADDLAAPHAATGERAACRAVFDELATDNFAAVPRDSMWVTSLAYLTDQADVGNTALFLLSNLSRGITGQTIYVDAGYSIIGI